MIKFNEIIELSRKFYSTAENIKAFIHGALWASHINSRGDSIENVGVWIDSSKGIRPEQGQTVVVKLSYRKRPIICTYGKSSYETKSYFHKGTLAGSMVCTDGYWCPVPDFPKSL